MKTWPVAILLLAVSLGVAAQDEGAGAYKPPPPPEQPIPFSHKQHATASLGCMDCHRAAASDLRA